MGAYLRMRLDELAKKHGFVKEVRGIGLMVGMELTVPGKQIVTDCMNEGLLVNCTHDVVLRFLPPYIITQREVDQAIRVLAKVLKNFHPEAK
jgi:acetylornithine/succinyldiaminopimelate/putrescine aminotransferase